MASLSVSAILVVLSALANLVASQSWFIEDGYYTIRNAEANTMLDLYDYITTPGTGAQGYHATGGNNQLWRIVRASSGNYNIYSGVDGISSLGYLATTAQSRVEIVASAVEWTIYAVESGAPNRFYFFATSTLLMDLSQGSPNDTTPVVLFTKNSDQSSPNQQWVLQSFRHAPLAGTYSLINVATLTALDTYQGVVGTGTPVVSNAASGATSQQWTFTRQSDGNYQIMSSANGVYLDFQADVQQGNLVLSTTPKPWLILPYSGNSYAFFVQSPAGNVVDLPNGMSTPGTQMILYPKNSGTNQQWILQPVTGASGDPV